MGASGWVHITAEVIVRITEKAMLIRIDEDSEVWLPLSQIADSDGYEKGDEDIDIAITEFIAREKGLGE